VKDIYTHIYAYTDHWWIIVVVVVVGRVVVVVVVSVSVVVAVVFNDIFPETLTIQRRMRGWQVNDEMEMMWKEAVVA
jgi:hypothetical protein